MNEDAAVQAVVTVIEGAAATLVSGLTTGGKDRAIQHISDTVLYLPALYYALVVDCTRAIEYEAPRQSNAASASGAISWVEYEIVILVAEVAYPDPEESTPYSATHSTFRKLGDRIARLVRETTKWFPTQASTPRFRKKVDPQRGSTVTKQNFNPMPEGEQPPILGCEITFTLVDHCSDSSLLYP